MKNDIGSAFIKAMVAWLIFALAIFLASFLPINGLGPMSIESAANAKNLVGLFVPVLLFITGLYILKGKNQGSYAQQLVGVALDILGSASAAIWASMFFVGFHQLPLAIVFLFTSMAFYFLSMRLK